MWNFNFFNISRQKTKIFLVAFLLFLLLIFSKENVIEFIKIPVVKNLIINFAKVAVPIKNSILMRSFDEKISLLNSSGSCIFCDLSQGDFKGGNLINFDLRYANLAGANLSNVNLTGANLSNVNLTNTNLSQSNLNGANLMYSNFSGAILEGVDLSNKNLIGANFTDVDLSNIDFHQSFLHDVNFSNANLSGVNLSGKDLTGVNLSRSNLEGANLSDSSFINTNLSNSSLIGANLTGVNLEGLDLSYMDLTGANLSGANLSNRDLTGTMLQYSNLTGANLDGVNLTKNDLTGANLDGIDFTNTTLTDVILTHSSLKGSNLDSVDLSNKDLTDVNFTGVDLRNINLSGSNLSGVDFSYMDLTGANLSGANLSNRDLTGTILHHSNLTGTILVNANLSDANLSGTNLNDKDLTGTILTNANLYGVNLSRVDLSGKNLIGANLKAALLFDGDISNAKINNKNLKHLTLCNSRGVDGLKTGCDLRFFDFSNSNLSGINFQNLDLSGVILRRANLGGINLTSANLSGADLTGATLTGANLTGANLIGANITDAFWALADGVRPPKPLDLEITSMTLNEKLSGYSEKLSSISVSWTDNTVNMSDWDKSQWQVTKLNNPHSGSLGHLVYISSGAKPNLPVARVGSGVNRYTFENLLPGYYTIWIEAVGRAINSDALIKFQSTVDLLSTDNASIKKSIEKLSDSELILKAIGSGNRDKIKFAGNQALDNNIPSYKKDLVNRKELIEDLFESIKFPLNPLKVDKSKGEWSLVVIPDTQYYVNANTQKRAPLANMVTAFNWIGLISEDLNIKMVQGLGDITENNSNNLEWEYGSKIWKKLEGVVPFAPNIGNHDDEIKFKKYFPEYKFTKESWWGGNFNGVINSYQLMTIGKEDYLFANLDCPPIIGCDGDGYLEALNWMSDVLEYYPNRKVILATHDIWSSSSVRKRIITQNDNIVMTNAGHSPIREKYFIESGPDGGISHNFVANYQFSMLGEMFLRFYVFKPLEDKVYFYTYSPITNEYEIDENSQGYFDLVQKDP